MELTKTQSNAVEKIVSTFDFYNNKKTALTFKAPTGSGKTFMIANVIDKMLLSKPIDLKLVFVYMIISDARLPYQILYSFNKYKKYLNNNNIEIKLIESPSVSTNKVKDFSASINAKDDSVLIMGLSSFGATRIFTEQEILDSFLEELKTRSDLKLVYIRDEAHRANSRVNKDDAEKKLKTDTKLKNAASFVIEMTATPKEINENFVEITEEDLKNDEVKLLKENLVFNSGLNDNYELSSIDSFDFLDVAIQKFKQIKEEYKDPHDKWGLKRINPAMLIQFDNKTKGREKEFEDAKNKIIKKLQDNKLSYAIYFSDEKVNSDERDVANLEDISKSNSSIDVILFKVGPAVGWNIPRACMLVQLRNVNSESLNIQTIGRIKRNPNPGFKENWNNSNPSYHYYIYSNNLLSEKSFFNFKVKKEYKNILFPQGNISRETIYNFKGSIEYKEEIKSVLWKNEANIIQQAKKILSEYENTNKIIVEEESIQNSENKLIKKIVTNAIELYLYNNEIQLNFEKVYWNKNLSLELDGEINKFQLKHSFLTTGIIKYVLFKLYSDKLTKVYKKYMLNGDKTDFYKINKNYALPERITDILDIRNASHNPLNTSKYFGFCWKNNIVSKNNAFEPEYIPFIKEVEEVTKKYDIFIAESLPEKEFLENIGIDNFKQILTKNTKLEISKKQTKEYQWVEKSIPIFKNPVKMGIGFDYIDSNYQIRKSFPDFVFVIGNHYLFIEVKSKNDYDSMKTQKILESYEKYILANNQAKEKLDITFVICQYENKNNVWFTKLLGFSSSQKINNSLNESEENKYSNLESLINDIVIQQGLKSF
ncbi:DEAD/DEAH box helicase [[Mycoplasma] gypis]|uniref:DEAD/DEAH box helicase family protein n=1 Tax=[Mycoplasma] gypis TaxID=92404 RepID=A0ABZ2RQM7_9BACT|nr:DEAD/DEAH box helicase family protein [[Mycoplasma] gypis]MBN0919353.1 DEAD/DEAH box helicase family protein [[Mycoplasma] gypis]